ncbi:MAG: hypothetical protein QM736_13225 [Vicinamibacterales bacterium]
MATPTRTSKPQDTITLVRAAKPVPKLTAAKKKSKRRKVNT